MKDKFESLMISVSGIRGKVSEGFSLEAFSKFAHSFGTYFSGKNIALGRDTRPSGPFINSILQGIFLGLNKNIFSAGIVPTPTLKSITREKADSGIMISASHNPIEWNAFKFINQKGFFISQDDIVSILDIIEKNSYQKLHFSPDSKIMEDESLSEIHLDSVLKQAKLELISKQKFKVFLDTFNGAGSEIIPKLLERLGCKSFLYRCDLKGSFPLKSEPNEENLKETSKAILNSSVDIGFATDPDADRLVVLTPKRGAISEEYTFALALYSVLLSDSKQGNFITNLSTSFISEEIAEKFGVSAFRSKVGEANVVEKMLQKNSFLGGEGNGGVIDPKVSSFGRDSLIGIVHILNLLSMTQKSIDDILDDLPKIFMKKEVFQRGMLSFSDLSEKFTSHFSNHKIDRQDGVHFSNDSEWVHVRSSNTEPILRVMYEAKTKDDLDRLSKKISLLME